VLFVLSLSKDSLIRALIVRHAQHERTFAPGPSSEGI